ncbi:MAG: ATP synthase F0 subunit A [Deltaproteobacteria bacterium]|nr:MAG: ATP synthase F0 subunit A [Deltaproteobacteria bacterium]
MMARDGRSMKSEIRILVGAAVIVVLFIAFLPTPLWANPGGEGEHGFTWISLLPFFHHLEAMENPHPQLIDLSFTHRYITAVPLVHAILVVLFLIGVCLLLRASIRKMAERIIPPDRVTGYNFFELLVALVIGLIDENMGREGRRFLPLLGTIFIYILFANLLGLIPGFLPPTDNLNTNAGMAIVVFVAYQYYGFREHGIRYIKHFTGPVWWLAPLMVILELIGHLARPFSLSVRLFGNIMGDHLVLVMFATLVPLFLPIPFLLLGTFVAFLQAFIFTILSLLYISGAVAHEH